MRFLHESSSLLFILYHSSLKKNNNLKPKAVREWTGENPGGNKHAFLKSLDFLMTWRETLEGEETVREIHVIGYRRVAEKSRYGGI